MQGRSSFAGGTSPACPSTGGPGSASRRTFQRIELFAGMTVRDHLLVAERARLGTGRFWKDVLNLSKPIGGRERAHGPDARRCSGSTTSPESPVEALSLGRARLVEVGRALMTEPKLLLLDEPSSGLDGHETEALAETLRAVQAERGTAVLLVEHDVEFVRSFSTRLSVLDFGHLIATGPTAEVLADDAVRKAYLGETRMTAPEPSVVPSARTVPRPLLELRDVERGLRPVPGPLRRLARDPGRQGARAAGLERRGQDDDRPRSRRGSCGRRAVRCSSRASASTSSARTASPGWGSSTRPRDARCSRRSRVEENLVLAFRREFGRRGACDALARAYELFPRLGERRKQVAGTLSGGEQRMLSLARVLVHPPRLLIADELSLGLAPIVIDEVYRNLAAVRDAGTTLLLVEQYVGHALQIADEVAVLTKGTVAFRGPTDDLGDLSEWLLPTPG